MTVDRESVKTVGLSLLGALLAICSGLTFLFVAYTAVTVDSNDFLYEPTGLRPLVRALEKDLLTAVPGTGLFASHGTEFSVQLLREAEESRERTVVYRRLEPQDDIYRIVLVGGTEESVTKFGKVPKLEFQESGGGLELNWEQRGRARGLILSLQRLRS